MIEANELLDYLKNGMYGVVDADIELVSRGDVILATVWFEYDNFVELTVNLKNYNVMAHDTNCELIAQNVLLSVKNYLKEITEEEEKEIKEIYVIIADWEDMDSEYEQPKQYGLQYGEFDDRDEMLDALDWLRKNYMRHGYSNFSVDVRIK